MDKLPKVKVHGCSLDVPRVKWEIIDKEGDPAQAEQAALERDAKRYRWYREHVGMTPTMFDEYIDDKMKRWEELHRGE